MDFMDTNAASNDGDEDVGEAPQRVSMNQGHRWQKYHVAFRGLIVAIRNESSFWIHVPMAAIVVSLAFVLQINMVSFAILLLCIAGVISAECINTSIESMVKTLHPEQDPRMGHALDVSAAAVLVLSIVSVIIGFMILGPPLWEWVTHWMATQPIETAPTTTTSMQTSWIPTECFPMHTTVLTSTAR